MWKDIPNSNALAMSGTSLSARPRPNDRYDIPQNSKLTETLNALSARLSFIQDASPNEEPPDGALPARCGIAMEKKRIMLS